MKVGMILVLTALLWVLPAMPASAGPIMGPTARPLFDQAVLSGGYTLQDFNAFPGNTALTTQIPGLTFESHLSISGSPMSGVPVNVSAFAGRTGTIVGRPCPNCLDDGRVGYRITFSTPQAAAGIQRNWHPSQITRFYTPGGTLLHEFSGEPAGYFGYFAETADTSLWVGQVELDGNLDFVPPARQVGYSDDLIYGTALIPEPSTAALLAMALLGLAGFSLRAKS